MLEESIVVVPGLPSGAIRESRQLFFIFDRLGIFATSLRGFSGEREVETLDRLAAFEGKFGANAALVFKACDLVASGAAEMAQPPLAFVFQVGVVHERRVGVRRRFLLLLRDQIGRYVLCVLGSQAEAGHHRHVLHLQFVAIVGALAVVEIELVGKSLFGVILRTDIFLLVRTVGTGAFAGVVNPANEVVVICLLTDAG